MRIAIDTGATKGGHSIRGIGVMVGDQIEELKNVKTKKPKNLNIDSFDFGSKKGKWKLVHEKYDIIHYPYFFPYSLTLPKKFPTGKVVVTIQDLIHLIYPKNYPPGIRGKLNLIMQKMRLKSVDAVVTISETSKKDIVRFLDIPADKIYVVHLAPQKGVKKVKSKKILSNVRKKYDLPKKFVLYVGDVNYNKNILNLIKACKILNTPLVIVGKHATEIEELGSDLKYLRGPRDWVRYLFNIPHPELAHFKKLQEEFKDNSSIFRLGYVEEKELSGIYSLASVYVQPSFYEGFGLPVLEAMACETPVVVSRTNALTEVAGNASLVADPNSPKDIANKMTKILNDSSTSLRTGSKTKKLLIERGKKRVKEFTWSKTAKNLIEVYKKVNNKQ